jgi:hypothetical protein
MAMSPKITLRMKVLALLVGSYLTAMEISNYRHSQLAKLYSTSVSYSSETSAAESAVRKLNSYRGSEPKDLLVKIATGEREFHDDRQEIAIQLLMVRGNTDVTRRIAVLLQPSVGLSRRQAVATALENAVCEEECTRFVLHYLERRWSGSGIREDFTNAVFGGDVSPTIEREQARVVEQLDHTLSINVRSTLSILRNTYGLGSPVPSGFSLYLLQSVHIKEACPFLEVSEEKLMDSSKDAELQKTLRELGCPPTELTR